MERCPSNTITENNICKEIIVDKCTSGENKMDDNIIIDKERTETFVRTYISEFNYTINHVVLYTSNKYKIIIYKNKECIKELNLEMPKVDFKECYDKVKSEYNIEEELAKVIINIKDMYGGYQTYYSFFHPITGYKLNAVEICQNETIVVNQNLSNILGEEGSDSFLLQTSLTEQGINIFDVNDPFYTDLSFEFKNPTKKDIPLSKRLSAVYPNASLCEEGCQIEGIDLEKLEASCNCKFHDIGNNDLIKGNAFLENSIGEVFDIINSSNILVMKCFKYIFKHFTQSIGGIISTIAISLHLLLTVSYFICGKSQIIKYVYGIYENFLAFVGKEAINIQSFPPKKEKNQNLKDKTTNNKKGAVHFNETLRPNKGKKKIKYLKTEKNKSRKEKPIMLDYDAKSSYNDIMVYRFNSSIGNKSEKEVLSEKRDKFNERANIHRRNKSRKITVNSSLNSFNDKKHMKEGEYKLFFDEYFATSIDQLEYDEAIIKDQRNFCIYLRECLKKKQMIAFTFISSDPLKIRIIKIMVFILNTVLYFVIIGFFYSEEYIGELYDINKKEGFFDYIPRNGEKFVYTVMASIIIGYIVDCFFEDERKIKGIFKREKENALNLRKKIMEFIKDIHNRYLSFIILILVLLLISFYYLLCFNYVYQKTQSEWVKASLTMFVIMQILSILRCFLEACLRFSSYCCQSEKLFKISKLLD